MRLRTRPLFPALLLAAGVLSASTLAVQQAAWLVSAAPLALALSVLVADALDAYLQGAPARPAYGAMILAASFLMAGLLVATQEPAQLKPLMPLLAACAAVAVSKPRNSCLARPN